MHRFLSRYWVVHIGGTKKFSKTFCSIFEDQMMLHNLSVISERWRESCHSIASRVRDSWFQRDERKNCPKITSRSRGPVLEFPGDCGEPTISNRWGWGLSYNCLEHDKREVSYKCFHSISFNYNAGFTDVFLFISYHHYFKEYF